MNELDRQVAAIFAGALTHRYPGTEWTLRKATGQEPAVDLTVMEAPADPGRPSTRPAPVERHAA